MDGSAPAGLYDTRAAAYAARRRPARPSLIGVVWGGDDDNRNSGGANIVEEFFNFLPGRIGSAEFSFWTILLPVNLIASFVNVTLDVIQCTIQY